MTYAREAVSAQTSDTTGHDPQGMLWVVFSYQLQGTPDVLIRLSSIGQTSSCHILWKQMSLVFEYSRNAIQKNSLNSKRVRFQL